jgi:hypothetical protein
MKQIVYNSGTDRNNLIGNPCWLIKATPKIPKLLQLLFLKKLPLDHPS